MAGHIADEIKWLQQEKVANMAAEPPATHHTGWSTMQLVQIRSDQKIKPRVTKHSGGIRVTFSCEHRVSEAKWLRRPR